MFLEDTPSLTYQHDKIQSHHLSFPIVFKTKISKTREHVKTLLFFEKAVRDSQESERNYKNQRMKKKVV